MKINIDNIKFTIVIPTHNRYELLYNLLQSIGKYRIEQLAEIIVVDDSENLETIDFDPGVRLVHVKLKERVFISRAKNIGWKLASTELVFFIDDDNQIDRDTLLGTLRVFADYDKIGASMPSVLYQKRPDLVWVYATPFKKNRWGHDLIGRNLPRNSSLEGRIYDVDALPNASMISVSALRKVGGFEEKLRVNSSGTITIRIRKLGLRTVATSSAFIYHDVAVPGTFGFWSEHGRNDPERVREEIMDWFGYMKLVHAGERFFMIRALFHSATFLLPNVLTYAIIGNRHRTALLRSVAVGLLDTFRNMP
jgi:GT2 family glycosyltransferase